MKYFEISFSIDRNEVGTIPQINRITNSTAEDVDFYHNLLRITSFPESIPKLDLLQLDEDAILTDLVHITYLSSNYSYLISPHFKEIIDQFTLEKTAYFDAIINEGKTKHTYYLLLFLKSYQVINYEKSEFMITDLFGEHKQDLAFDSFEAYEAYNDFEIGDLLVGKKVILNKNVDLFNFPHNGIFFSERLKNKVEEAELTGMVFNESSIEFSLGE